MPVGYPKTQAAVDNVVGQLTQDMNKAFRRAVQLNTELSTYSDTVLQGVGYTAAEVTQLRTLAADLVQLNNIYTGVANLATAKDFRVSLRPMWGILGDN